MKTPDEAEVRARSRRAKAFSRRDAAARAGIHLPSVGELLRGQSFCGGSWEEDAHAFAERLLLRVAKETRLDQEKRQAIQRLTMAPSVEQCLNCANVLREFSQPPTKIAGVLKQAANRCDLYAANQAHRPSMYAVAGHAAAMADADHTPGDERLQYARAALGWLLVAATHPDPWPQVWLSPARRASTLGGLLTERMISEYVTYVLASKEKKADTFGEDLLAMRGKLPDAFDLEHMPSRDSVVVLTHVGNHDIGEGKKVLREFADLVSQPLPLVPTPDLSTVARTLNTELPHAVHITSAILSELVGRTHVRLPPLLFVGPPGAGKSYYAARLLEMLNVRAVAFPCGGVADAAFAGTSRRWASGTPAFPLSLIRQHKTASPGLILDELERASANTHNGSLFDALRGMLEPETAGTWVDAYLEAPVNLSHVIWIATTNSLGQIPRPLRDRFRVFGFPPPTVDDLSILALHLLQRLVADLGWDARWASPLDQEELNALASVWPGGSMRVLRRYVQGIWRARLRALAPQ